jgi:hypothetical protein
VGATHLLPQVERKQQRYTFLTLALGIVIAILILLVG